MSNDSGPIDLLVLPRISSERGRCSETTGCTSLFPYMVGVAAAPSAADMRAFSACFSEGRGPFGHQSSTTRRGLVKIKLPSDGVVALAIVLVSPILGGDSTCTNSTV